MTSRIILVSFRRTRKHRFKINKKRSKIQRRKTCKIKLLSPNQSLEFRILLNNIHRTNTPFSLSLIKETKFNNLFSHRQTHCRNPSKRKKKNLRKDLANSQMHKFRHSKVSQTRLKLTTMNFYHKVIKSKRSLPKRKISF